MGFLQPVITTIIIVFVLFIIGSVTYLVTSLHPVNRDRKEMYRSFESAEQAPEDQRLSCELEIEPEKHKVLENEQSQTSDHVLHPIPQEQTSSAPTPKAKLAFLPYSIGNELLAYTYKFEKIAIIRGEEPDFHAVKESMPVELVQEPDNPYDKGAVKVVVEGTKLGYLFKGQLQNMVNDYTRKQLPIAARICHVIPAREVIQIDIGFYNRAVEERREAERNALIAFLIREKGKTDSKITVRSFRLVANKNGDMQDNISTTYEGHAAYVEKDDSDYERERYLVNDGIAELGYLPASGFKFMKQLEASGRPHAALVGSIDEGDNEKLDITIDIFTGIEHLTREDISPFMGTTA